jgi:hypothetical protein
VVLLEYQELDLEDIASRLTWYTPNEIESAPLPFGTLCRDRYGQIWFVGNISADGTFADGIGSGMECGCHWQGVNIVAVAFLGELLKGD